MHNGTLPSGFAPNVVSTVPNIASNKSDTKAQNRRNAPERISFRDFLYRRHRAEEEESLEDEDFDMEELDDEDMDDEDYDGCGCSDAEEDEFPDDGEDDPEEFDDFDEERELEFDDEDDERAPFPLPGRHDDEEDDTAIPTGRFSDFFRMDDAEEEEEENDAPGGFEPGQAVGTIGGMGSNVSKIDRARILMRQLVNKPGITRDDIIDQFMKRLPTTESTAVSYYEDIAREMGLTGDDEDRPITPSGGGSGDDDEGPVDELPGDTTQELSQEEIAAQDPNSQGITRTVEKAHLVYKRQMEDGKFEELWVYNIGDSGSNKLEDSLNVRRNILSGTDIPRGHTRSEDGQQSYTLHTMGNAQLLHITGLAN